MKKIISASLLIFFLATQTLPQEKEEEGKVIERVAHLTLSLALPLISSTAEYHNQRWGLDGYSDHHSRTWHDWQFMERVTAIGLGVSIALHSDFEPLQAMKDLLLSGILFWTTYDISLNKQRGLTAFYVSRNSGSRMEELNLLKIPIFIVAIAWYLDLL
ncbi:hypothetical protein A2755_02945 [Candidatus Wolfebacteria bacterium RIFCSPHIGHO2_01_FULL_48_22]|uniref:Uncharacterized protein n=2 Tax=Candidatus Wolfeibacteriota TaxID=1752735 RepID=A0A1F8DRV0_9BACT|nr:MAG: hypothetical protein A2755_02945 [Candidatus Wolfebacteria bacterium RIFCSPHIGHO2_01_FULL_48_22]OGM92177.1 MAG: hypothetical protein A2935_00120 [Candidatus Wolfebacteria bacterium RIFCSPLOWO2_01_FULL_47_17b]